MFVKDQSNNSLIIKTFWQLNKPVRKVESQNGIGWAAVTTSILGMFHCICKSARSAHKQIEKKIEYSFSDYLATYGTKKATTRKMRNQKETPTPKTEVGKT